MAHPASSSCSSERQPKGKHGEKGVCQWPHLLRPGALLPTSHGVSHLRQPRAGGRAWAAPMTDTGRIPAEPPPPPPLPPCREPGGGREAGGDEVLLTGLRETRRELQEQLNAA